MNSLQKYGLEILRFIDARAIGHLFEGDGRPDAQTIAKALLFKSKILRNIVLQHLNRFRRASVSQWLDEFTAQNDDRLEAVAKEADQQLLERIAQLDRCGMLLLPDCGNTDEDHMQTVLDNNEAARAIPTWQNVNQMQCPSWEWADTLNDFDLFAASLREIIVYWVAIADHIRRSGPLSTDAAYDHLKDTYSQFVFEIFQDDCDEDLAKDLTNQKTKAVINALARRFDVIRYGIRGIHAGVREAQLLRYFDALLLEDCTAQTRLKQRSDHFEISQLTPMKNDEDFMVLMLALHSFAFEKGFLALEGLALPELMDKNFENYLRMGLEFLVDGHDWEYIEEIMLTTKIRLLNLTEIKLKMFVTICQHIRLDTNPRVLQELLQAYIADDGQSFDIRRGA